MSDDYLAIAERMPADMQTIYMRGFPAHMNMDTIRNFFLESSGRCTFAFHKKSLDGHNLFIALRFDDVRVAEEVIRRYHDRHVLGYRVKMKYFKDHKQAREIADDHRRDRRDDQRTHDRSRENDRFSRHGRQNSNQLNDLRSDLNLTRERNCSRNNNNNNNINNNRRSRRRPAYNERSRSREDHRAQPDHRSDYYEQNDREIPTRRSDYHSLEEEDEEDSYEQQYHENRRRVADDDSDNESKNQMHYPRSPSYSPPPSPERQPSSIDEESDDRRSRSRSSRGHHRRHSHHHHRNRRRSDDERKSHSKSPNRKLQRGKETVDEKQQLPNTTAQRDDIEVRKASSTIESPSSPQAVQQPIVSNSAISLQVSEYAESVASKVAQIAKQRKEQNEVPVLSNSSSVVSDSNPVSSAASIPPERIDALVRKKTEVITKYQEQCETVASVANMFIREDPTATETIQSCMCSTLRRLADDTLKEMDDFVKQLLV